ncbi:cupin domain-containing protein [Roseomonas sp. AR75]|uniref:cupin domain-containing protein n=1 Tax=Roseomonas sp. AR75 TaxID=2562311 RepID=UPI0014851154|nr:cupin domain-containing protein [Roseomonas sp. AR75]
MARPHIEWIQAQALPWQRDVIPARPGTEAKVLSRDEATGALTCIIRYPAGYARGAECLQADEEFWVLDGDIAVDGVAYGEHTYAHLPRAMPRSSFASRQGATVLTFFSATPVAQADAGTGYDARRLVRRIAAADNIWDGDFASMGLQSMQATARMRTLRKDPDTGEITYLTATMPFRQGERSERHPVVQEFFLLSGELAGELGVMQAGAYCWRPPMFKHAPYGSWTGTLLIFRSVGGPQTTEWEDPDQPFTWTPAHKPILPADLAPLMARPWPRPPRC